MAHVKQFVNADGTKEGLDSLLRRFKKAVTKDETLLECRRRQYFMTKAEKRKEKAIEARKKATKNYKPKY